MGASTCSFDLFFTKNCMKGEVIRPRKCSWYPPLDTPMLIMQIQTSVPSSCTISPQDFLWIQLSASHLIQIDTYTNRHTYHPVGTLSFGYVRYPAVHQPRDTHRLHTHTLTDRQADRLTTQLDHFHSGMLEIQLSSSPLINRHTLTQTDRQIDLPPS